MSKAKSGKADASGGAVKGDAAEPVKSLYTPAQEAAIELTGIREELERLRALLTGVHGLTSGIDDTEELIVSGRDAVLVDMMSARVNSGLAQLTQELRQASVTLGRALFPDLAEPAADAA